MTPVRKPEPAKLMAQTRILEKHPPSRTLAGLCLLFMLLIALTPTAQAMEVPSKLIDAHRATPGCWLADMDNAELKEKTVLIDLEINKLYGFVCATSLSGDSYRFYLVENGREEWAQLVSFPQLDTKIGWLATTQLQKPTWDSKNKLLRSEIPKKGSNSNCRQYSIFGWNKQQARFHIAQVGLAGDCEENPGKKDLIIYPFVEEVEEGQASGQTTPAEKSN